MAGTRKDASAKAAESLEKARARVARAVKAAEKAAQANEEAQAELVEARRLQEYAANHPALTDEDAPARTIVPSDPDNVPDDDE